MANASQSRSGSAKPSNRPISEKTSAGVNPCPRKYFIDVAPADGNGLNAGLGLNFGWSGYEGNDVFNADVTVEGHYPPIYTYPHDGRCSVSGGVRVRGGPVPALEGWYVYGDYCSGLMWALEVTGKGSNLAAGRTVDLPPVVSPTAVVAGPNGETYVLSLTGPVYRLDPA